MSSHKILAIIPKRIYNSFMIWFMENNLESLGSFIARIMFEKKLTSYQVHKQSGEAIGQATVIKLKNGNVVNPTKDTLKGLAKGLGVSEEEVFAVARGATINNETKLDAKFENLSLKFSGLPDSKKSRLDSLIELMDREIERVAND